MTETAEPQAGVAPGELRDRAAILAARSAALLDEADECAIRAELAERRDGLLLSIEAARLAEEQADKQATETLAAAESMTAEVAECHRRLEMAKAGCDGDLAVRIESRIVRRSIEEEIGELWPQARAAEEAAKLAVTTAALARQARDRAESELGRLAAAESAPLTNERAPETVGWSARALRRWHEVILDPGGFTPEHRQAAMRMLWHVLASRWGRDAALDLANRVKAERVMYEPRIEFGPDGVTVLQPGIALTGDGTGQAQRASEAQAARASAAANRAIAGDLSLAQPVRSEPAQWPVR